MEFFYHNKYYKRNQHKNKIHRNTTNPIQYTKIQGKNVKIKPI